MKKLALILALALLVPGLSLAETLKAPEPAPGTPALSLPEILLGGSCVEEPTLRSLPGGCSRTCKVDRDCRYYPDEVCISGCCVF